MKDANQAKPLKLREHATLKKRFKQNWDCYLYLAPYGIIFFVFTILPVFSD